MEKILYIYNAFKEFDYVALSNPEYLWWIYLTLFCIFLLESGIIITAFLPGDSLLFLTGILIGKGVFDFSTVTSVMIAGTAIGTWLGYLQGYWLGNTRVIKNWMDDLPQKYHEKAILLFHKYGLFALFFGRFIAFVRTIMPVLVGISKLQSRLFHVYNILSAALWVLIIVYLGYKLGDSKIFEAYENLILLVAIALPLGLLVISLIGTIFLAVKKLFKKTKKSA